MFPSVGGLKLVESRETALETIHFGPSLRKKLNNKRDSFTPKKTINENGNVGKTKTSMDELSRRLNCNIYRYID